MEKFEKQRDLAETLLQRYNITPKAMMECAILMNWITNDIIQMLCNKKVSSEGFRLEVFYDCKAEDEKSVKVHVWNLTDPNCQDANDSRPE